MPHNPNVKTSTTSTESAENTGWEDMDVREEAPSEVIDRFNIPDDRYPFFAMQDNSFENRRMDIRETLGQFVRDTADLIATIDGTGEGISSSPADHVVYLDKSARPVSWLVNTFWKDFSDKPRPSHSYLAVDRKNWFNRAGVETTAGEYFVNPDGTSDRLASFHDFEKLSRNITRAQIARVRAAFIKGGLRSSEELESRETDLGLTGGTELKNYAEVEALSDADVEAIFAAPTGLEDKEILVIDEVKRSGSTLEIAQWLLKKAIPEAKGVHMAYFWNTAHSSADGNPDSVPVWYDSGTSYGRGIGDVDRYAQIQRYLKYRDNPELAKHANLDKLRAQLVSYPVRGTAVNLSQEPRGRSREVAREIQLMHEDYEDGKIFMMYPKHYNEDKYFDYMESLGVKFTPDPHVKDSYVNIMNQIKNAPQ